MKKCILLFICTLLLFSCSDEKTPVKNVEEEKDVIIEEEITNEYLEADAIRYLVNESNKITTIIEIDTLHELIIEELMKVIDFEESLESQEHLIEEITLEILNDWKAEVVRKVVIDNDVVLNDDDFYTVVMRTSIKGAMKIMTSYEKIYLRKYY